MEYLIYEGERKPMNLIMQLNAMAYGQAFITMIINKDVNEVIKDMKTDGETSIGQLIEILDNGKYYDLEKGTIEGDYPYGKITSFLGIFS